MTSIIQDRSQSFQDFVMETKKLEKFESEVGRKLDWPERQL